MITYYDDKNIKALQDEMAEKWNEPVHFEPTRDGMSMVHDVDGCIYCTSDLPDADEACDEIAKFIAENY